MAVCATINLANNKGDTSVKQKGFLAEETKLCAMIAILLAAIIAISCNFLGCASYSKSKDPYIVYRSIVGKECIVYYLLNNPTNTDNALKQISGLWEHDIQLEINSILDDSDVQKITYIFMIPSSEIKFGWNKTALHIETNFDTTIFVRNTVFKLSVDMNNRGIENMSFWFVDNHNLQHKVDVRDMKLPQQLDTNYGVYEVENIQEINIADLPERENVAVLGEKLKKALNKRDESEEIHVGIGAIGPSDFDTLTDSLTDNGFIENKAVILGRSNYLFDIILTAKIGTIKSYINDLPSGCSIYMGIVK